MTGMKRRHSADHLSGKRKAYKGCRLSQCTCYALLHDAADYARWTNRFRGKTSVCRMNMNMPPAESPTPRRPHDGYRTYGKASVIRAATVLVHWERVPGADLSCEMHVKTLIHFVRPTCKKNSQEGKLATVSWQALSRWVNPTDSLQRRISNL